MQQKPAGRAGQKPAKAESSSSGAARGGWVCGAAQSSAAQRSTPYAGQDLMEVGGMEGNGWNGWMDGWMW